MGHPVRFMNGMFLFSLFDKAFQKATESLKEFVPFIEEFFINARG